MDPMEFLEERDPLRRGVMQAIAWGFRDIQRQHDRERAILNANEIAQVLGRMFSK